MKKRLLSPCALPTVVITLTVLAVSLYCVRFISAAGTTLGDLATSMQPGSWVAVPQTNIDSILGHGTRKGNNLPYSMSGKWDSVTHRLHFLGADDGEPHIYHVYYDEASNSWVDLGFLSGFGSAPGIHGYDQLALDPVTRQLYFNPYGANPQGTKVYRYFLASNGPWNFASQYTPSGNVAVTHGVDWFDGPFNGAGVNGVLAIYNCGVAGGEIVIYDAAANRWIADITGFGGSSTDHCFLEHSKVHNVAILGGGDENGRSVWRLNADGTVTALSEAPVDVGIQKANVVADPVTGNFLVMGYGQLWELDPRGLGTWTLQTGSRTPPSSVGNPGSPDFDGIFSAAISNYGVVAYTTCRGRTCNMSLYKHAGRTPTPVPSPPSERTSPAVSIASPNLVATVSAISAPGRILDILPGTDVFGVAAQSLLPGDTLIVHQGTYNETLPMSIQVQGTAAAPITIMGATGESRPVITRPTTALLQNTINIDGLAAYITIRGLEIVGNGGNGVNMGGTVSFITLEDLVIHDVNIGINFANNMNNITVRKTHIYNTGINGGTGEGIYVGCNTGTCIVHDSLIEQNWIHDSLPGTAQGDGIEVNVGSHSNTIRDNVIYNRAYPGIFVYGTGTNPVNIVEGNVIWNTLEGIYAVADAIVRNNIVTNSGTGLSLYPHAQVPQMKNLTAVNNTLYDNDEGIHMRWIGATNMVLANNAIYSPDMTALNLAGSTGTFVANYVEGTADRSLDTTAFIDGGSATNAFVDPATWNFWLTTSSPLIGTANSTYAPGLDFNGGSRVSPFDVGAYETNAAPANPGWQMTEGFKSSSTRPPDTTPPTVSITSPANGSTVSATITVSATASDNRRVAGVQFKLDGVNLGTEDTRSPYSRSWNTTTASNGSHTLTAVARDFAGNQTTSTAVTVTVSNTTPDTTPPTVSITSPASGATVSASITVSATASDNVGVAGVQFKLDGANLGAEDTSSPYSTSWDTTTASNGSHTLTAVARDAAGNQKTSTAVAVTVSNTIPDTTPPTVSISSPASGSTVSATITVSATASDNVGVAGVQFKLDGTNLGAEDTSSPYSTSWDTTTASNGSHTLTAVARDAAGNQKTSTAVTITVSNSTPDTTPPTVSISSPASGSTASATITVSATASDNVGVAGVQFKLDGANLGAEDTSSPYSISWNTTMASNGSHTLAAVARDAAGNQTTSAAVTVTVNNAPPPDTTPPTVSISSPASGSTVSATITVSVTASDNVGVAGVQFKLDAANLGTEDTTSPYSTSWNTTTTSNGSHTLTAVARDAAGNQTTSTAVTVTVSNGARTVEIQPGTNVFSTAAQSLMAGDTLIVHQGTYNETNRMSIQVQGTATAPITITGAAGESRPVITRPTSAPVQDTIIIEGSASYLTIRGLEITGNGGDGLNMTGTVSFITLEDLVIHDIDVGINFTNSMNNITVRKNHIYNTGIGGGTGEGLAAGCYYATCIVRNSLFEQNWIHDTVPGTAQGDGIEIKVGSYSNTIRDNVVYNRPYPGIFVYGTGSNPVNIVEGNVVWNVLEGIYAVADAIVRNNIVLNSGTGLSLYPHAQVPQMKNLTAVNNTLYNNDEGIYMRWNGATNMILANNAVYSPGKTALNLSGSTGTFAANYVEGTTDRSTDGTAFINGGTSTNAFVNPANMDFWLKTASPLIGTANGTYAPGLDFNASSRVSPFDVGAYESNGATSNPGWRITQGFKNTSAPPPDTTPPTVSITSPASGSTVSATITVSATASDNVGVAGVQFKLDGANLGAEDTTASPYSISWNTTTASNGSHTLTAIARDAAGNQTTSTAVIVTVSNTTPDTTPPTVSITSPASGATVSASITVSATASDNVGVAGVQFKLDGANLGAEDTTASPYSISWNTTTASNGSHTLTAVARDAAGNQKTSTAVTVTVSNTTPDTTPPTVSITSPASSSTVSATITVSATASDNVGVAGVQFKLDGANLGAEDTTASPYSVSWNTTTASNGSHTLTAVARDAAGNQKTSTAVTVTVSNTTPDTTPPTVSITSPASSSTVSATITVSATASDNVGVAGVQFKLDGANLGAEDTTSPYSTSWNTTTASNGSHALTAVARDAAGNQTTSSVVTVTVNNAPPPDTTPPAVSLTSPVSGSTVSATITVSANASDNVGVAGVQFKLDGANLGAEDTTSPYSTSWNTTTASNGSHTLTAVARDAAGNQKTSSAVTVTVANNQPPVVNAGPDQTITLPSSANLNGTATDDGLPAGSTLTTTWSKVSGPGTVTFGNVNAPSTTASFSAAGTYVLRLTGSDGASSSSNDVTIFVNTVTSGSPTTPGTLSLSATFEAISVSATFSNDSDGNNSATIRFRKQGDATWKDAYTPIVDRRTSISGHTNPYVNQVRGSIVGLAPGTTYEVALTFADPNGVSGTPTLTGTVTTIAATPPLSGNQIFVDAAGGNGNGSAATPFNSISNALNAATAGDTIRVMPGTYPPFTVSKSGAASGYIAIVGESRDQVFISGGSGNNITVNGDYIQLKNLRLKQSSHNSIEVQGRHHVWIDNIYHENISSSRSYDDAGVIIFSGSHNVYVLNNQFHSQSLLNAPPANPRWDSPGEAIYIAGNMDSRGTFVFKGNIIDGGFRDCIGNSPEDWGGGINNSDIAYNTITNCKDDAIQMEGDDVNLRIYGNDINANNGYSDIAMAPHLAGPVYIFRNVFRENWSGDSGYAFKLESSPGFAFYIHNTIDTTGSSQNHDGWAGVAPDQYLFNNIIKTSGNPLYAVSSASVFNANLYFRTTSGPVVSSYGSTNYATVSDFRNATGQEQQGRQGDPAFADAAKHITSSSPAADAGIVIPNFNDAASAWPYKGAAPDMGAYELP